MAVAIMGKRRNEVHAGLKRATGATVPPRLAWFPPATGGGGFLKVA